MRIIGVNYGFSIDFYILDDRTCIERYKTHVWISHKKSPVMEL